MRRLVDPLRDLEVLEIELAQALADQTISLDRRADFQERIEAIRAKARDLERRPLPRFGTA